MHGFFLANSGLGLSFHHMEDEQSTLNRKGKGEGGRRKVEDVSWKAERGSWKSFGASQLLEV